MTKPTLPPNPLPYQEDFSITEEAEAANREVHEAYREAMLASGMTDQTKAAFHRASVLAEIIDRHFAEYEPDIRMRIATCAHLAGFYAAFQPASPDFVRDSVEKTCHILRNTAERLLGAIHDDDDEPEPNAAVH